MIQMPAWLAQLWDDAWQYHFICPSLRFLVCKLSVQKQSHSWVVKWVKWKALGEAGCLAVSHPFLPQKTSLPAPLRKPSPVSQAFILPRYY